jgi:hypothetical protein
VAVCGRLLMWRVKLFVFPEYRVLGLEVVDLLAGTIVDIQRRPGTSIVAFLTGMIIQVALSTELPALVVGLIYAGVGSWAVFQDNNRLLRSTSVSATLGAVLLYSFEMSTGRIS